MGKIFVRAKPSKITITETYYYKGFIGDNSNWEFQKAEGEIKLVFPFDGYYQGHFNRTAQKDLKKQDPDGQAREALVGHLAIVKAGKTSFKPAALESSAIPITIDVENIWEKLEGSQEYIAQIEYRPDEPENRPVSFRDVKLTDQDPFEEAKSARGKPQYYTYPKLLINFSTSSRGDLLETRAPSPDKIKELIKAAQAEQYQDVKFLPGDCSAKYLHTYLWQLAGSNQSGMLLIGLKPDGQIEGLSQEQEQDIPHCVADAALLNNPPIPVFAPVIVTLGENQEQQRVAVVITPPGQAKRLDRQQRPDRPSLTMDSQLSSKLIDELSVQKDIITFTYKTPTPQEKDSFTNRLATVLAGLANGKGGYVIFGVESGEEGYRIIGLNFQELYTNEQIVEEATGIIEPWHGITYRKNHLLYKRSDGSSTVILIIEVAGNLTEVYTVKNQAWKAESEKKASQIRQMAPEEIFELFSYRYRELLQRTVVRGEPPKIAYGRLRWPHTRFNLAEEHRFGVYPYSSNCGNLPGTSWSLPRREQQPQVVIYLPSKYDPLQGGIEWHEVPFSTMGSVYRSNAILQLDVRNPEELRDPDNDNMTRDLAGYFEILLGSPVLSELEILYFDTQGEKLEAQEQARVVSQQTKIVLDIQLRTSDLFKKRDFSPYRQLEFEGVLPERPRYDDVREALQDCGLRAQEPEERGPVIQKGLTRDAFWWAESRTEAGKFIILLIITNYWYEIEREISYGERTDKMAVPSGRMTIGIFGSVEGAENKKLTALLNKLQIQLKERFKFVRVG